MIRKRLSNGKIIELEKIDLGVGIDLFKVSSGDTTLAECDEYKTDVSAIDNEEACKTLNRMLEQISVF